LSKKVFGNSDAAYLKQLTEHLKREIERFYIETKELSYPNAKNRLTLQEPI